MNTYPRILTLEHYPLYLDETVIKDYLRNVTDLDVDIEVEPEVQTDASGDPVLDPETGDPVLINPATGEVYEEPDPKLVQARRKLDLFIRAIEDETLGFYEDQSASPVDQSLIFDFDDRGSRYQPVALQGYAIVTADQVETQQAIDDGTITGDDVVPKFPDGTLYRPGDPNILEMARNLLLTLRSTIANVALHETERPERYLAVKSEGQSREEYVLSERPRQLYHRLDRFDLTTSWY